MFRLLSIPLDWATKLPTRPKRFFGILLALAIAIAFGSLAILSIFYGVVFFLIQTGYVVWLPFIVGFILVVLVAWAMSKEDWS